MKRMLLVLDISALFLFIVLIGCVPINSAQDTSVLSPTSTPMLVESRIKGQAVYSKYVDKETSVTQIFLKNLDSGDTVQLTETGSNDFPKWSPDGSQISYISWTNEKHYDIYVMDKDGKNKTPIVSTNANEREADWSPNGDEIVFVSNKTGNDELYKIDLDTKSIVRLTDTPEDEAFPQWSSNGNSIAFISTIDGGRTQISIMDANGTNIRQVTGYQLEGFDRDPVWCPDSSCIVFTRLSMPAKLMLIDLNTMEMTSLLGDSANVQGDEGWPARSPVRGFITFAVMEKFFAIDMKTKETYPLEIQGLNLSLYP